MIKNLFADSSSPDSLGFKFREKRLLFFKDKINSLNKPLKILDVGGTLSFWADRGYENHPEIHVTVLNFDKKESPYKNIISVAGDATNLSNIKDNQFDVCFSNSVIEHLFNRGNQVKMAKEVQRISSFHFVQTPNRHFFVEPHYLLPFFQFLPKKAQYFILTKTPLSRMKRWDKSFAKKYVDEIRLISLAEMKEMFPQSKQYHEKFLGMSKSFTAHNFSD